MSSNKQGPVDFITHLSLEHLPPHLTHEVAIQDAWLGTAHGLKQWAVPVNCTSADANDGWASFSHLPHVLNSN